MLAACCAITRPVALWRAFAVCCTLRPCFHLRFTSCFLGALVELRKATVHFVMSVRPHGTARLQPDGFSWNVKDFFFENMSRKFKFHYNLTIITGTLHEYQHTFIILSPSLLLTIRNVSGQCCREDQNTHFVFSNFFFSENRVAYEIMWKNIVQPNRPRITKWLMRIACWITKSTNTHTQNM